jgi:CheY-like chemotaxis protein
MRMNIKLSRDELVQNLTDSGLLAPEELDRARAPLASEQAPDGAALAQQLIDAGTLTSFQVDAISNRRFESLKIGQYVVLERLGAGGMGTVFKARHLRMRRVVAIKVLSQNLGQDEQFVKRFQREVEAVACLSHPNIVMAYDAGEAEQGHFLVMEFVDGHDLASELDKRGALPVAEAVNYVLQAARALEYAHSRGIIHRDIKPANLLLDASGVIKVADLGLARFEHKVYKPAEPSSLTQPGTVMGTVDFMPPEQAMGLTTLDHRADIYSLGCTLYFLLVGKPPFEGATMMAVLVAHRENPVPSLAKARKEVPTELDALFQLMLAKDPANRPQTFSEVVRVLEALQASLRTGAGKQAAAPATLLDSGSTGVWQTQTGAAAISASGPTLAPAQTLSVLLVEPSRTQAGIIRKLLQTQGVQDVEAVATGKEALEAARTRARNVVVCAMHLADMTGLQLAERVRAETKAGFVGLVLISSEAESQEVGSLSRLGNAILLKKPFTAAQLGEALRVVGVAPASTGAAQARNELGTVFVGSQKNRSRFRVLIVDDSSAARAHIRSVLNGLGFSQLVDAPDGARAVAVAAADRFDLIVTDYNMPFMDGGSLTAFLKQNPATASVPIIMVTTETDAAKLEAVRKLGVAGICEKSFAPEHVQSILERLVPPL